MTKLLEYKLKFLREFQEQYPTSHVGGSVGLMLQGIHLKRSLEKSDLDLIIDELDENEFFTDFINKYDKPIDISSNTSDFDIRFSVNYDMENIWYKYTKVEIRINPEPSFDVIEFEGNFYNVSKLRNILFWKTKYAKNGSQKHIDDLFTIKFGRKADSNEFKEFVKTICPKEYIEYDECFSDELPF